MDKIRLNKYLSSIGIASRRKVDELIEQKKIKVNGKIVEQLGLKINPAKDEILVNDESIKTDKNLVYFILNKPKGVVSTVFDELGRKTVIDLIKTRERIYPIGKLEQDSSGLILLTNDGELTQKLTNPKNHIPKTYEVFLQGNVEDWQLNKLKNGVVLNDGKTAPTSVKILTQKDNRTLIEIILYEEKNRQVRRMCAAIKLNLLELKSVAIGSIQLGGLEVGKYRELSKEEIEELIKS